MPPSKDQDDTAPSAFKPEDLAAELLPTYYQRLFPHKLFYDWLSYGHEDDDETYFERREFSFTLPGDIYVRYQSFSSADELHAALVQKCPIKIDIGAVFSTKPKDAKKSSLEVFRAVERELVFDIDMTDYDDVRTCCQGADLCQTCWPFLAIAARTLDRALRQDFGFEHLFWVYSGRRGIHCWVADAASRTLSLEARAAVADYLTLLEGGHFKAKKVSLGSGGRGAHRLHPSVRAALELIEPYFEDLVIGKQRLMDSAEQRRSVIGLCDNAELQAMLLRTVLPKKFKSSLDFWVSVQEVSKGFFDSLAAHSQGSHFVDEVKLQLCYPRLDINVSKGLNHLLKAPFCVHPKTGRVCVPLDIATIDSFRPSRVPTVSQLLSQLAAFDESLSRQLQRLDTLSAIDGQVAAAAADYEMTSIKDGIKLFEDFVRRMQEERVDKALKEKKTTVNEKNEAIAKLLEI